MSLHRYPTFLLVDDDPIFGELSKRFAQKQKIDLDYVESWRQARIAPKGRYDVIIIDYDLRETTGLDLARYFSEQPVILISKTFRWVGHEYPSKPKNILRFLLKRKGPKEILETAIRAMNQSIMEGG